MLGFSILETFSITSVKERLHDDHKMHMVNKCLRISPAWTNPLNVNWPGFGYLLPDRYQKHFNTKSKEAYFHIYFIYKFGKLHKLKEKNWLVWTCKFLNFYLAPVVEQLLLMLVFYFVCNSCMANAYKYTK